MSWLREMQVLAVALASTVLDSLPKEVNTVAHYLARHQESARRKAADEPRSSLYECVFSAAGHHSSDFPHEATPPSPDRQAVFSLSIPFRVAQQFTPTDSHREAQPWALQAAKRRVSTERRRSSAIKRRTSRGNRIKHRPARAARTLHAQRKFLKARLRLRELDIKLVQLLSLPASYGPECRVLYTVAHFVAKSTSIRALASTSERQLRDVCTAARAAFTACLNTARALWLSSARNHSDSLSDHLELLARAAGSIWVEISRLLATISFIFPGVEKRAMLEKEEIMVFESLTTTLQKFIFSCFEERSFVFGNAELEIKSLARILRCLYSHQKSTGQSKQNLKTLENFVKGQASCAGSTETIPLITQADVVAHSCAAVLSELLDRYEDREECSHTSTRPFSELSEAKIARRKKNICLTQDQLWRGTQHLCQLIEECAPFMSLASPANSNEADRSGSSSRFRFCREWLRGQLLASDRSVEDLLEECVPNSRLSKHKHGTQAGFSKVDHRGGLTFSLARIRVLETLLCLQRRYQDDE